MAEDSTCGNHLKCDIERSNAFMRRANSTMYADAHEAAELAPKQNVLAESFSSSQAPESKKERALVQALV